MARKVLEVRLSADSLGEAAKYLEAYAKSLDGKARRTAIELARMGARNAEETYDSYEKPYETNELLESIDHERTPHGARVVAKSDHAAFFEFGTGVVGQENPYPFQNEASAGWNAGASIGGDGHFTAPNGLDAWYVPGFKGLFTSGMPSRPFMAPAALYMRANLMKVARKEFK